MIQNKTILITGGTGSFGQAFIRHVLPLNPKALRIFSRDELKQSEMVISLGANQRVRFFIGDVRDKERVDRAMSGVDIVIHAAALKQVPSCEYNPFEAVKTNIMGGQNVISSAIDHRIEKVIVLSTDKAVNPVNLYGATKMCLEKIAIAANSYVGKGKTKISVVRYGNVAGSRGSILKLIEEQKKTGTVTITHKDMTRFWITLEQSVTMVTKALYLMKGGEVFVPKIPSVRIEKMVKSLAKGYFIKYIGIRPGEKINECLITEDEARHTKEFKDYYVITPEFHWWTKNNYSDGKSVREGFRYSSDTNAEWLKYD